MLEQEITVGLSVSLSGRLARQGQQALDGIRLWAHPPVRLIYYDDQSRASIAQRNTVRLLEEDRVDVLFGPYGSHLTMAVAPVAEAYRKLLWNYGGTSDEIFSRGHRWLVSNASPASDYLRRLPGRVAGTSSRPERISIVYNTRGTFASQVARGVVEAAPAAGFPAVALVPKRDTGEVVHQLRLIAPEVLVLAGNFEDEVEIMRARHLWPGSVRVVAAVAAGVQAFYKEIGDAAEGVIGPSQWEPNADSNWFVRDFRERFGQVPEYTAAAAFAMGLIVSECIRRAGSVEDERLRAVAAGLDFNTFYGRFRIEPVTGRQIGHQILLIQWRDGRKIVVDD